MRVEKTGMSARDQGSVIERAVFETEFIDATGLRWAVIVNGTGHPLAQTVVAAAEQGDWTGTIDAT